ncbi:MAG: hypothetical protein IK066_05105 [Kiritimatiellae bacterium]|nr:hypothetical protein [Kiritimatiellia bacterium]
MTGFAEDAGAVVPLYGGGAWTREALRRLEEGLGAARDAGVGEARRAVAGAVERFLREEGTDRATLPEEYVDLLLYRGLRAAGRNEEAQRWAAARLPKGHGPPVFDPRVWPGAVPLAAWELFSSGAVRPLRLDAGEGKVSWVLDFRRLAAGDEGWMELTLLPGLGRLLEALAPAWEKSEGRGTIGLRGLAAAGFGSAGGRKRRGGQNGNGRLDAKAVRRHCEAVLARLAASRGWKTAPDVVEMDFAGRK